MIARHLVKGNYKIKSLTEKAINRRPVMMATEMLTETDSFISTVMKEEVIRSPATPAAYPRRAVLEKDAEVPLPPPPPPPPTSSSTATTTATVHRTAATATKH